MANTINRPDRFHQTYIVFKNEDLVPLIDFLNLNKTEYHISYNAFNKRDGIQVVVVGDFNEMLQIEYCVNNILYQED